MFLRRLSNSCLDELVEDVVRSFMRIPHCIAAFPTDTIYGLTCPANDEIAIDRIYRLKKRSTIKPMAICVGRLEVIYDFVEYNEQIKKLIGELLPGKVTLILKKKLNSTILNKNCYSNNGNHIAVRMPDSPFIRQIVNELNVPLALTSANESNMGNTTKLQQFNSLLPHIDLVVRDDELENRQEAIASTIIDLTTDGCFSIKRFGYKHEEIISILNSYNLKQF
ncbi:hypothetical protein SNEBB_001860 [Seison nebaliae]|nr:hypothetical protein SNEBB_001860 [Seison nebaliae]